MLAAMPFRLRYSFWRVGVLVFGVWALSLVLCPLFSLWLFFSIFFALLILFFVIFLLTPLSALSRDFVSNSLVVTRNYVILAPRPLLA